MNLPSRSVSYSESVISKFPIVLRAIQDEGVNATELYVVVKNSLRDLAEFVSVLDCLYALGKVDIENGKVVKK